MWKYVFDACNGCETKGKGIVHGMVLDGLEGTVATRLSGAGCSNASVALQSDHRN